MKLACRSLCCRPFPSQLPQLPMRIFSHPERFFEAFSGLAERVTRCAELLKELLADPARAEEVLAQTSVLDHEAVELRQQVLEEGAAVAVTPLPREDVH